MEKSLKLSNQTWKAERLGIPYVPPYIGSNMSRTKFQGVNFAVAGAAALGTTFLDQIGVSSGYRNVSLRVQLSWFRQFLHHLCPTTDCNEQLKNSLIFMGVTGGVDYSNSLTITRRSIDETRPLIPLVVDAMISAISEIIELGGVTLMVPGNFPLGCVAAYLASFQDSDREEDYDPVTGCHVPLNKFVENHNDLLQRGLSHLQQLHPGVSIIYVDLYHPSMELFRSPEDNGFYGGALRACCGAGGPYNVIPSIPCGYPLSTVCDNPDLYVNWDGGHLTEKAYHWIFKRLFVDGPYTIPQFNFSCSISGLVRD